MQCEPGFADTGTAMEEGEADRKQVGDEPVGSGVPGAVGAEQVGEGGWVHEGDAPVRV